MVAQEARKSMAVQVQAMLDFYHDGIPTVDYGNNIRQEAFDEGVKNAFDFPGFVPAYIRPYSVVVSDHSVGLLYRVTPKTSTKPMKK